ncbi:MAG: hypothetical protein F6J93_05075 [Oscillatoria sp. SIO1A7]|nr:hypothetical protein [Oscillatoria sp. SIO1A7]
MQIAALARRDRLRSIAAQGAEEAEKKKEAEERRSGGRTLPPLPLGSFASRLLCPLLRPVVKNR